MIETILIISAIALFIACVWFEKVGKFVMLTAIGICFYEVWSWFFMLWPRGTLAHTIIFGGALLLGFTVMAIKRAVSK